LKSSSNRAWSKNRAWSVSPTACSTHLLSAAQFGHGRAAAVGHGRG
jgi:hypothetical protein